MKNYFSKDCSIEILEERNKILKIINFTLLLVTAVSGLLVKFSEVGHFELKVFFIAMLIVLIRFEFWSTCYWVDTRNEEGLSFYRDNIMKYQRNFLTFRKIIKV